MNGGAIFDPTGQYRYRLWRQWDETRPTVVFMMLNPSAADAQVNDPTLRRCIGFAQAWGFGALEVVNLFAYRTPEPTILKRVPDPVGLENDQHLHQVSEQCNYLVCAWGNGGSLHQRDLAVQSRLNPSTCYCLGWTQAGHPRHPLYLPLQTQLRPLKLPKI